jgi:hypothetical protein
MAGNLCISSILGKRNILPDLESFVSIAEIKLMCERYNIDMCFEQYFYSLPEKKLLGLWISWCFTTILLPKSIFLSLLPSLTNELEVVFGKSKI